jgi:hypothetical protein
MASVSTVSDLLHRVQDQYLTAMPHENLGFRHIIHECTDWPKWTRFSSIVQHTNLGNFIGEVATGTGDSGIVAFSPPHDVADVWVWSTPAGENLTIELTFGDGVIPDDIATKMIGMLCSTIEIISADVSSSLQPLLSANNSIPALPLPLPEPTYTDDIASEAEMQIAANPKAAVEHGWKIVLGERTNTLRYNFDTSFLSLRGDIMAAVQFADIYRREEGLDFPVETILEHPTMRLQMQLLGGSSAAKPRRQAIATYKGLDKANGNGAVVAANGSNGHVSRPNGANGHAVYPNGSKASKNGYPPEGNGSATRTPRIRASNFAARERRADASKRSSWYL